LEYFQVPSERIDLPRALAQIRSLLPAADATAVSLRIVMTGISMADWRWIKGRSAMQDVFEARFPELSGADAATRLAHAEVPSSEAFEQVWTQMVDSLSAHPPVGQAPTGNEPRLADWVEDLRLRAPMFCATWRARDLRLYLEGWLLGMSLVGLDTSSERDWIERAGRHLCGDDSHRWDQYLDQASDRGAAVFAEALEATAER